MSAVTLEDIAARLDRIETALAARPVTAKPVQLTYTPRQLAEKINRSYRWVIQRCAAGVIPTTTRKAPYLIPVGAADAMFSQGKSILNR